LEYNNIKFVLWDIGYQSHPRAFYKSPYSNTDGIIFVVDSVDRDRIGQGDNDSGKTSQLIISNPPAPLPLQNFPQKLRGIGKR
jgi:hypothetical protein